MSSSPEDFGNLQKLMKLKRYEQPPPGYFNTFSTCVINRLEADERVNTPARLGVWRKFLSLLETNPMAAGIFGISVCGLLISGIAYSQRGESEDSAAAVNLDGAVAANGPATSASPWGKAADTFVAASTEPVLGTNVPGTSLSPLGSMGFQEASFTIGH
jgi:hypothetical protein